MRLGACDYCGNAIAECPCLEHAKAIVYGIFSGPFKDRSKWLQRYVRLQPRFSERVWAELIEQERERRAERPDRELPAVPLQRYRFRDELDLRLQPRRPSGRR